MTHQRLITISEAARLMHINPWQVSYLIQARGLKAADNPPQKRGKWYPQHKLMPLLRAHFKHAS